MSVITSKAERLTVNPPLLLGASTYDELWRQIDFEAMVPPRPLNMGSACIDAHAPTARAIVEVMPDGSFREYTFAEFRKDSNRLANALTALNVERGDRVAVISPPSYCTAVALMTSCRMGGITLPISSLFGPDAIRWRLSNAGAKAVIVSAENLHKVREALANNSDVIIIVIGDAELRSNELAFEDLLASSDEDFTPPAMMSEEPGLLIYTSGTTGNAKGALHAQRVVLGHLTALEALYEFAPCKDDVIWSPADWAWIAGFMNVLVMGLYHGIPVVVDLERRFDAQRALSVMRQQNVTLSLLPATALRAFRSSDLKPAGLSLRAILSGGESLGAELLSWGESYFQCIINEGYGQTELNGPLGNCKSVFPIKPGSLGRALPGARVTVLNSAGEPIVGSVGEIAVHRSHLSTMLGYWDAAEATASKFHQDWLLTGDLGVEDEDGYFWFKSRKDDVINSSGFRIGPGEIEDCLGSHEAVALVAVIGAPDERRGEVPVAYVVLREGKVGDEDLIQALRAHVRQRLAAHEVPRDIIFRDDLPLTATGKIQRRCLRDER